MQNQNTMQTAPFAPWSPTAQSAPAAIRSKHPKPSYSRLHLQPPGPSSLEWVIGREPKPPKRNYYETSTWSYSSRSTSRTSSTSGDAASTTTADIVSCTTKTLTATPLWATRRGTPAPSWVTTKNPPIYLLVDQSTRLQSSRNGSRSISPPKTRNCPSSNRTEKGSQHGSQHLRECVYLGLRDQGDGMYHSGHESLGSRVMLAFQSRSAILLGRFGRKGMGVC